MKNDPKTLYHRPGTHHEWGQDDWDEKGLNNAGRFIYWMLTRIGRIGCHHKEKWGTLRVSTYFYYGTFFCLLYPGYVSYARIPKWLQPILCHWRAPECAIRMVRAYQIAVYKLTYRIAFARWPHLWLEIGWDSQHELLGIDARSFGWHTAGKEEKNDKTSAKNIHSD